MRKQADANQVAQKWFDHNAIKSPATQSAQDWARINLSLDDTELTKAMEGVYASGWAFGAADAAERLGSNLGFDWDNWKAGNEAAAALVDYPSGLQNLLNKSGVVIRGLDNTTVDRIGTALAIGLSQGLSVADTAKAVNYVIDNPLRAMVIARTETARALVDSNVASYRDAKIQRLEWLVGDPCPICAVNANAIVPIGEEFPSGNAYPPAHPNCVCDVAPVIDDDLNMREAISEGTINETPTLEQALERKEFIAGQWSELPARQDRMNFLYDGLASRSSQFAALPREIAEEAIAGRQQERAILKSGRIFKNGDATITVVNGARVEDDLLKVFLAKVDELQTQHPREGLNITIKYIKGAYGNAYKGTGIMNIDYDTIVKGQSPNPASAGAFKMPALGQFSQMEYTLSHEWGHLIDAKTGVTTRMAIINELKRKYKGDPDAFVSKYANKNASEMFAEMFAEWRLTNGTTTNPIVQDFAETFGWNRIN